MITSAFRRSTAADTRKKAGKGGKAAWFEKMRLPQDNPTPLMLISAEYVDPTPAPEEVEIDPATGRPKEVKKAYAKAIVHTRKAIINGKERFLDEICSAGSNPHNPQPCVGCYAEDSGDKSVGKKEIYLFGFTHLIPYHGHPVIENNQVRMKGDGSGPLINYSECQGRTCNFCRVLAGHQALPPSNPNPKPWEIWPGYRREDLTTIFAQRRYTELGKGHLSDLQGWDAIVSSQCGSCRSQLITDGFACPSCNNMVIDMSNDPRTDQQIAEAVAKPYPCLHCSRPVILREVIACDTCAAQGRQPRQLGIFDVVLWGMRQGEGTKSHLVLQRFETLEDFSRTAQANQLIASALQGKTVQQVLQEVGVPYDFASLYAPRDLKAQSERLMLPMPQQAGGAPNAYATPQMVYPQANATGAVVYGQVPQAGYAPTPQPPPQMMVPQQYQPQAPQQAYIPPQAAPPAYAPPVPGQFAQPALPQPQAVPFVQYPPQTQQPQVGPPAFVPPTRPNYGS
jgi:hypothetical protein